MSVALFVVPSRLSSLRYELAARSSRNEAPADIKRATEDNRQTYGSVVNGSRSRALLIPTSDVSTDIPGFKAANLTLCSAQTDKFRFIN
jgi:hypothetical protein